MITEMDTLLKNVYLIMKITSHNHVICVMLLSNDDLILRI